MNTFTTLDQLHFQTKQKKLLRYFDVFNCSAPILLDGMALLHASKYAVDELRNLGMSEVALGLLAGLLPNQALLFWAIGFGLFPIFYGIMMYKRYEGKSGPVTDRVR